MKKIFKLGFFALMIGSFYVACASPHSVGPDKTLNTTVSGLAANVSGGIDGCTFQSYDKDTNDLKYTCTPSTCNGTCFGNQAVVGSKQCMSTYIAANNSVDIHCSCKINCAAPETPSEVLPEPAAEMSVEPAMEVSSEPMIDAGPGTEPVMEQAPDAGSSDQQPGEMVAEVAPVVCAADETKINNMCFCNDILNYSGSKPWQWKWCNNSLGKTYVIFRGTTTISCVGEQVSQASINKYQWRCNDNTNACVGMGSNTTNFTDVMSFTHNGKIFSFAALPVGWIASKSEGYPTIPAEVGQKYPYCWRIASDHELMNIQAIDWKTSEPNNPWQSHKP